ncbi:MAG TPA: hypothetical protein VHB68_16915, partial [Steroidobacteraceae bacterium]|nr:hypothetical protein [Steroidobacteraceae bacterium]
MQTCLSPNGAQLTEGTAPLKRLLVATIRGIYTLERGAADAPWKVVGAALERFQVSSLLHEPRSGRLFAGTHGADGLWSSDDGGVTWVERSKGVPSRHIYTIACQYR